MKKDILFYEQPYVEVVDVDVELGFATSNDDEEGNEGVGQNPGGWGSN